MSRWGKADELRLSVMMGLQMRYRENIPLAVMSVISVAVLFIFGISEMEMRATQRQHNSCSSSQETAIARAWLPASRGPSPPASVPCPQAAFRARMGA
jgi:hypothetical protein